MDSSRYLLLFSLYCCTIICCAKSTHHDHSVNKATSCMLKQPFRQRCAGYSHRDRVQRRVLYNLPIIRKGHQPVFDIRLLKIRNRGVRHRVSPTPTAKTPTHTASRKTPRKYLMFKRSFRLMTLYLHTKLPRRLHHRAFPRF